MTDTTDNNTAATRTVAQTERHIEMNINGTIGARCFDNLHRYVGYKWLQGRAIQERLDLWRDALVAAFDAVAEHDNDRVISIPALPDSDTAINVLSNWDSYLGHGAVWDILTGVQEAEQDDDEAPTEYRVTITVTLRAEDLDSSLNAAQDAVALAAWQVSELSPFDTVAVEHVRAEVAR